MNTTNLVVVYLYIGHESKFVKAFTKDGEKGTDAVDKKIYLPYDMESLAERRVKVRDVKDQSQMEFMYQFSREEELDLELKKLQHYKGTNRSEWIGPIVVETEGNAWRLTFKEKKDMRCFYLNLYF